jgi:DNA-binding winged helix-turn-helix (wHTH) protein
VTAQRIGEWDFDAESGELRRGRDCRRLEPRAARTLELLCQAEGGLVSQERLIAEVWDGRSLSENSVPVVISQLRRVLGDDARRPTLIETVPKRGYRLVQAQKEGATRVRSPIILTALVAILAVVALAFVLRADPGPVIAVDDVVNATGDESYAPLARATSELVVADLSQRGFQVRRQGQGDVKLATKLVLWNGQPSLGLTATDRSGVVRWSGMTSGSAEQVPMAVKAELNELQAKLSPSEAN